MSFFFLGLLIILVGVFFLRRATKEEDKEGAVGMIALIMAGVILTILFGLLYRGITLYT